MQTSKKFSQYLDSLIKTYDSEEIFVSEFCEALKDLYEYDVNNLCKLLTPFFRIYSAKQLDDESQREEILKITFSKYFSLNQLEPILKNTLLELSQYDKVIEISNYQYFYLLDILLANYKLHIETIETYRTQKKSSMGIAFSTSTTTKVILNAELNALNTLQSSMTGNKELLVRSRIYEEYLRNPHSANQALFTTKIIGGIQLLTEDENRYLLNSEKIINSAIPLEQKDILKSANILILFFFSDKSHFFKTINTNKQISNAKLFKTNEVLMQYLFDTKNTLNKNNIKKKIQIKTSFHNSHIYEFQNQNNIKPHPMLEETVDNEEFWQEILDFIKGRFPLK